MFRTLFVLLACVALPAGAQEEATLLGGAPASYTTPLAPRVACVTGDAVARIEAAAVYAQEEHPDAGALALSFYVTLAVNDKVAELTQAGDCVVIAPNSES